MPRLDDEVVALAPEGAQQRQHPPGRAEGVPLLPEQGAVHVRRGDQVPLPRREQVELRLRQAELQRPEERRGEELVPHPLVDADHAIVEFVARYKVNGRAYPPRRNTGPAPECRIEVSPAAPADEDFFLHVLTAADAQEPGQVGLWDWRSGQERARPITTPSEPRSVACRPDGQQVAVLCTDGQLLLIDPAKMQITGEVAYGRCLYCRQPDEYVCNGTVRFSPDGRRLAAASKGAVTVWDWKSGQILHTLPPHKFHSIPVAFSRDGRLATVIFRQGVKIWDPETGTLLRTIPAHVGPVSALAFFMLPLVFALFSGRSFCAGVCPHGALQDLVLLKPLKVPLWLEHGLGILPFVFLGAGVLFAATGSAFIICQYDPFIPIFRLSGRSLMVLTDHIEWNRPRGWTESGPGQRPSPMGR